MSVNPIRFVWPLSLSRKSHFTRYSWALAPVYSLWPYRLRPSHVWIYVFFFVSVFVRAYSRLLYCIICLTKYMKNCGAFASITLPRASVQERLISYFNSASFNVRLSLDNFPMVINFVAVKYRNSFFIYLIQNNKMTIFRMRLDEAGINKCCWEGFWRRRLTDQLCLGKEISLPWYDYNITVFAVPSVFTYELVKIKIVR